MNALILLACAAALATCYAAMARATSPIIIVRRCTGRYLTDDEAAAYRRKIDEELSMRLKASDLPLIVTDGQGITTTYNPTPFVKLGPYSKGKDRRL